MEVKHDAGVLSGRFDGGMVVRQWTLGAFENAGYRQLCGGLPVARRSLNVL
jgi:hypothetical protein